MRAGGESGWLPPVGTRLSADPFRKIPLVNTEHGQRYVDNSLGQGKAMEVAGTKRTYKPDLKPYEALEEVRRAIRDNFVRTKIDDEQLTYGAIRGMLHSLGDRFTRFLTPEEYKKFSENNNGDFTGIGARIDLIEEYRGSVSAKPFGASRPYIVEPMEGGPAKKAGLQKNDVILEIGGKSTAEMSENAVVQYIRGERGHQGFTENRARRKNRQAGSRQCFQNLRYRCDARRDRSASGYAGMVAQSHRMDSIGRVQQESDKEMGEALQKLRTGPKNEDGTPQGPARGLVFDLRDNPGGLLDAAIDIGSRFISEGPIVYQRERDGSEQSLNAERSRYMNLKVPIVVLVNNYSASAAEVVTGALKDKALRRLLANKAMAKPPCRFCWK
jgi:carboxyl-terminal processing protease